VVGGHAEQPETERRAHARLIRIVQPTRSTMP
jgi:hypothetical protein